MYFILTIRLILFLFEIIWFAFLNFWCDNLIKQKFCTWDADWFDEEGQPTKQVTLGDMGTLPSISWFVGGNWTQANPNQTYVGSTGTPHIGIFRILPPFSPWFWALFVCIMGINISSLFSFSLWWSWKALRVCVERKIYIYIYIYIIFKNQILYLNILKIKIN